MNVKEKKNPRWSKEPSRECSTKISRLLRARRAQSSRKRGALKGEVLVKKRVGPRVWPVSVGEITAQKKPNLQGPLAGRLKETD